MKKQETFEDAIPKPQTLWFKLWKAKQEIGKINKSADNPFFKSKYADLNTILDVVEPILHKYNLILLQPVELSRVYSRIYDVETGESVQSYLDLPVVTDPQKLGGCVSYFRRYTLQSLLSLSMQDDDANDVTQHVKNTKPRIDQTRFEKALQAISDGKYTIQLLKDSYELTDLQTKAIQLL